MLRNSCIRSVGPGVVAAFVALGAVSCASAPPGDESSQSSALSDNALTANALTANALTANALTANALTANALTANALTANALTANALRDPLSRELMKYVVSCALDDKDSITVQIDGHSYEFDGSLGLAPDWGKPHGSCDGSCQRWVSACVLARVDAMGVKREISVRGDNHVLHPSKDEVQTYTVAEGAYFGNLFVAGQPRFLCIAPGQTGDMRVCGPDLANCPMSVEGSCALDCADDGKYGAYESCSDAGRAWRGHVYDEVITVFLPGPAM
jgi:hypothetical protein